MFTTIKVAVDATQMKKIAAHGRQLLNAEQINQIEMRTELTNNGKTVFKVNVTSERAVTYLSFDKQEIQKEGTVCIYGDGAMSLYTQYLALTKTSGFNAESCALIVRNSTLMLSTGVESDLPSISTEKKDKKEKKEKKEKGLI